MLVLCATAHPPLREDAPERGGWPGCTAGLDERRVLCNVQRRTPGHTEEPELTPRVCTTAPGLTLGALLGGRQAPGTRRPRRGAPQRLHTDLLVDLLQALHGLLV